MSAVTKTTDFTSYKFADAILPQKFVICGVELRPFCLGHYILLEHIQNPILSLDESASTMEDALYWFFLALMICAVSYDDAVLILNDDKQLAELSRVFFGNLEKQMEIEKGWNFFAKMSLFKDYVKYYMDMPIYTEEISNDQTTPSGTDWKTNIFLIFKKLGYKENEILNMNMKKLFITWASYAEGEGALKVMNRIDLEALARMRSARNSRNKSATTT